MHGPECRPAGQLASHCVPPQPSERKKLKVVELAAFAAVRSTLHARHTERDLVADPATGGGHDET
jgi:hypothetical protein